MASLFAGQIGITGFKKGTVDYRYLYIPNFYDSSKQANLRKFYQTMKSRFNKILFVRFEPAVLIEYKRYTSDLDRERFLEEAADYLYKLLHRTYRKIMQEMIADRGGYISSPKEIYLPPLNLIGMNEGGCIAINLMQTFSLFSSTLKIDRLFVQTITLPELLKTDKSILSNAYFIVHHGYDKFLSKNPKYKAKYDEFIDTINTYTDTLHIMYTNEIEMNVEYLRDAFGDMAGACV